MGRPGHGFGKQLPLIGLFDKRELSMWQTAPNNGMKVSFPWGSSETLRIVFDQSGKDVAYVIPTNEDNGNANARLIAYAPSLLDVCRKMWREAKASKEYVPENVFQAARLCRIVAYLASREMPE